MTHRRIRWLLPTVFTTALLLALSLASSLAHAAPSARILVLHSYHQGLSWTDGFQEGIESALDESGLAHDLDVEYLDRARMGPDWNRMLENTRRHLRFKLDQRRYDLVMVTDNDALDFALKERHWLAPDIPLVFAGINSFAPDDLHGQRNVTGVSEVPDFAETIRLARRLDPSLERLLFLGEDTVTGRANKEMFLRQTEQLRKRLEVVFLEETDIRALERLLGDLGHGWMVLPACRPFDENGLLPVDEAARRVSSSSSAPVFAAWDFWMGSGPVGGKVVSSRAQGRAAAELAVDILSGTPADSMAVRSESPNVYMADNTALERFGYDPRNLPEGTLLLHYEPGFYDQYAELVWTYGAVLAVFAIMSISLIFSILHRRRYQKRAQEQAQFIESLLETVPVPLFYKDGQGRYMGGNSSFYEFFGFTPASMNGKGAEELYDPASASVFKDKDAELLRSGGEQSFQHTMDTPGGERTFLVHKAVLPHTPDGGPGIVGYLTDITEARQRESELHRAMEALVKAKEEAEAANEAKSLFLANMSHELRTPLSGIMGMQQLLKITELTEQQHSYVDMTIQSAQRLAGLLGDILDLTRIETGVLRVARAPVDIREIFEFTEQLFRPSCEKKGIHLALHCDAAIPGNLLGDPLRLQQVLNNVVGNAVKYTNSGSVAVSAHLLRGHDPDRRRVFFSVADTGIGVADEDIETMFQEFTQADQGYQRMYQGAGLGLSIVRRLVELLGGALSFESELGVGTTFSFCLPFDLAQEDSDSDAGPGAPVEAVCSGSILVAEDESVNRIATGSLLERAGYRVHCVTNGEEAVRAVAEGDFDLVLMDVQMPVMDGVAATRAIREGGAGADKSRLPIIALTAYAMDSDRRVFLEAGMDECISKPVDPDGLAGLVASLLGKIRAGRS